ncbi:hypothetical protein L484_024474 [Morus notabilis]|uniref:Uncharacterized protein n=1 Tax=Morus notabilis TaxID=981085 RepID=W9RHH4_9ROSA|nr:hypothetical protein L484_024474 [Morus notabilis]
MAFAGIALLQPISNLSSATALVSFRKTNFVPCSTSLRFFPRNQSPLGYKSFAVSLALTESDSAKSIEPDPQFLLQQLADSFDLPQDYFSKLPGDLRLELNDAAFDLSNGPVLDEIAKAMIATGRRLSATSISTVPDEEPKTETRMFKFGDLQVELTSVKANIGAVISIVFGILSWEVAQGIQSIPESELQYANDNALLLAKSLRGALLALFYSSTFLSAFTSVGLFLLARQLKSKKD